MARVEIVAAAEPLHAIHRHHDHGGVVDVGIMRVGVLERPAAGPHVRPPRHPVALDVEHLQRHQPIEALARLRDRALAADLEQRVAGERGVPHRRHAGLAIGLVVLAPPAACRSTCARSRAADRPPDSRARRTSSRCWPWPGRSRRGRPRRSGARRRRPPRDRSRAGASLRKQRLDGAQDGVDAAEEPEPRRLLVRRLRRRPDRLRAARRTARRW